MTLPLEMQKEVSHISLLLVDDNSTNLQVLSQILKPLGYKLLFAREGRDALQIAERVKPSLVLLDILMPGMDGFEVCEALKTNSATKDAVVIFLSALDDMDSKVRGFQLGGSDFITKPFQAEEVIARVQTHVAMQQLRQKLLDSNTQLQQKLQLVRHHWREAQQRLAGPLLGESHAIKALWESMEEYGRKEKVLLLTGPPGAPFEAVARAIHGVSERREQPFLRINAKALHGQQSELFEETPPSDSADPERKPVLLELADQGTLLVEHVESLSRESQEALALYVERWQESQNHESAPLWNVRILVSSTHGAHEVFSSTLLHPRLSLLLQGSNITLPSLSQRKQDIPVIAQCYLEQQAKALGKVVHGFSANTEEHLQAYHWPGDVRELENIVGREVALATGPVVSIDTSSLRGEGTLIGGYHLIAKLGEGGMGEVWRARHQWLKREAAVKCVRLTGEMEEETKQVLLQRFHKEAQTTAQLSSQHTVRLYDFGIDPSGVLYYAMELLHGIDLQDMVDRFGPLSSERVCALFMPVCRALAEAHQHSLVHRDIKPSNIFICSLGLDLDCPKILDFGVVKDTTTQTLSHQNLPGHVCGTPGFMAPELIQGNSISGKTDIYALGCVMYWCLTGRMVFHADNPIALLMRHISEKPAPPSKFASSDISPELDEIILRCLNNDPSKRPDALEFFEALENIKFSEPWTRQKSEIWWGEHLTVQRPEFAETIEPSYSFAKTIEASSQQIPPTKVL
ncbi:MAG: response regulator [Deltaproteobacteria bacterium]|nr:MAG: response regulator [Deltaproteobacteria bacterium]